MVRFLWTLTVKHHVYLLTTPLRYNIHYYIVCINQRRSLALVKPGATRGWDNDQSVTEWVVCETETETERRKMKFRKNKNKERRLQRSSDLLMTKDHKARKTGSVTGGSCSLSWRSDGSDAVHWSLNLCGSYRSIGTLSLTLCLMNWWKWALKTWLPTLQYSYGQQGSHPEPLGRWQILNHQIPCLFFPLKPALRVAKQRGEHRRIWERILRQWYHAKPRSEIILQYISRYFSKKRFSCRIS